MEAAKRRTAIPAKVQRKPIKRSKDCVGECEKAWYSRYKPIMIRKADPNNHIKVSRLVNTIHASIFSRRL